MRVYHWIMMHYHGVMAASARQDRVAGKTAYIRHWLKQEAHQRKWERL